jgi:hypothetical protein
LSWIDLQQGSWKGYCRTAVAEWRLQLRWALLSLHLLLRAAPVLACAAAGGLQLLLAPVLSQQEAQ